MNCAKCGADNREGRKFCAKCAAPLARLCPQCGASNEPGEDFCGECAAALGQPPTASAQKSNDSAIRIAETPAPEDLEGERKTVTALFADIKGSTELMEDLDPEEARAIVDPALNLMIDAVRRYDGYIVQSTGDGDLRSVRRAASRTKTIRSARCTRRCACRKTSSGYSPKSCAPKGVQPDPVPRRRQHRRSRGALDQDRRGRISSTRRLVILPTSLRGCRRWRTRGRSRSAKRRASCAKATSRLSRSARRESKASASRSTFTK